MLRVVNRFFVRHSRNVSKRCYSSAPRVSNISKTAFIATTSVGISGFLFQEYLNKASCEAKKDNLKKRHEIIREDLPYFSDEDLLLHDNKYHIKNYPGIDTSHFDIIGNACERHREKGIWISYGVGVYDITDLVDKHGTPDTTILLAAGMALDPFWDDEETMKLHDKPYVFDMLEKCRIGNIIKN